MAACALGLILIAPWAGAEESAPQAAAPPTASAVYEFPSTAWHLYGGFGLGAADGKYGDFLQKPLQFELRIAKQNASGKWRFGAGLQFGSMDPAEDPNIPPETEALWLPDEEWARLETSFSVTRVFNPRGTFRPYLQGRVGIERIHPRSALFYNNSRRTTSSPGRARRRPRTASGSRSSGASRWPSARRSWFFGLLLLFALFFSLGPDNPLHTLFFILAPGFRWGVRTPARMMWVGALAVAVLAGLGADRVVQAHWSPGEKKWLSRLTVAAAPLALLLGLGLAFGTDLPLPPAAQ